jgi:hypothetical protein
MNTASLIWGLLFSSIGLGYAIYGRKQNAPVALISGIVLMFYPYAVPDTLWLIVIGAVFMALPFVIKY